MGLIIKIKMVRNSLIWFPSLRFKVDSFISLRTKAAFQYDTWQDGSFDGRVAFFSAALSILNEEGWTYRMGGTANDLAFKKSRPSYVSHAPWSATTQLLVSF